MNPPIFDIKHNEEDLQRSACNMEEGWGSDSDSMHRALDGDMMKHVLQHGICGRRRQVRNSVPNPRMALSNLSPQFAIAAQLPSPRAPVDMAAGSNLAALRYDSKGIGHNSVPIVIASLAYAFLSSYTSSPTSLSGSSSNPLPNVFHLSTPTIGIRWEEKKTEFGYSLEAADEDDNVNEDV